MSKSRVIIQKSNVANVLASVANDEAARAVLAGGFVIETAAKMSMATDKSGRVYKIPTMRKRGVYATVTDFDGSKFRTRIGDKMVKAFIKHRASAPGEAPAIDTGNLVNSINTELESSNGKESWARVGTGVEYAEYLEMGTSKMQARPFMRPAFDENIEKIKTVMRRQLKSNIEGATK